MSNVSLNLNENSLVPIDIIGILNYNSKFAETTIHSHSSYEIAFIIKGRGIYNTNGIKREVSHGDFIIVAPGCYHYESYLPGENAHIIFINFKKTFSLQEKLNQPVDTYIIIHANAFPEIQQIIINIFIESIKRDLGFDIIINAELNKLFTLINRIDNKKQKDTLNSLKLTSDSRMEKNLLVFEAMTMINIVFLDKNSHTGISDILDISRFFYVSRKYLASAFKEIIGISPQQFLNGIRLEKAKELLRTSEESISSISNILGYENPSYFYIFFKRETSLTPSQFREKYRTFHHPHSL